MHASFESIERVREGLTRVHTAIDADSLDARETRNSCAELVVLREMVEFGECAWEFVVNSCAHVGIDLVVKAANGLRVGVGK